MRTFLGWQHPLHSLADALLARGDGRWLDLHELTVVVPSGRAGRRLLEMLAVETSKRGCALSPPRIVTSGRAPELFRPSTGQSPGPFVRALAWVEALSRIPHAPNIEKSFFDTLDLASAMDDCLAALAMAGLDPSQAKNALATCPVPCDLTIWDTFTQAYAIYGEVLRGWGYEETHGARRAAIEQQQLSCPGPVILAGVIEMPWAFREMVRRFPKQVEVLIFAPPERQGDFDEAGGLIPERWKTAPAIPDGIVDFVDGPDEQAGAVLNQILRYEGRYAVDEVVVGVPDLEIEPLTEARLKRAGIPSRNPLGRPLSTGAVGQLLTLLAAYLRERSFANLAALARHPDLECDPFTAGLEGDLPGLLDEYQSDHFIGRLPASWPGSSRQTARMNTFIDKLESELQILREPPTDTAAGWAKRLAALLTRIYGERLLNPGDPNDSIPLTEFSAVGETLRELVELPPAGPALAANDAIAMLMRTLGGLPLAAPNDDPAVELLGWLELAMDDAPALVVTGVNEGVVPASPADSPILPEPVRRHLGLPSDASRFARDAYILHVLLGSKKDLRLVAARRTGDGHPLLPSRLLLQDGTDNAAGRLLAFFQDTGPSERPGTAALPGPRASPPALRVVSFPGDLKPGRERCLLDDPPKPDPKVALPDSMGVTSFRAYLDCPYRYYLRYVLRLKSVTDAAREMDSLHFGNVMHEVLQGFPLVLKGGRGSAPAIRDCLLTLLDEKLRKRFGALSPAMHLQAGVMRRRLEAFAERQAEWSSKGYLVLHSELDVTADDRTRRLEVDGIPMHIHGRIDRIDVRDDGSEAVIFDYKTSGHAVKPEDAHVDGETWIDLQLPLYRYLIEGTPGLPATRRLGYINLPGDVGTTNLSIAGWTEEDLAGADEAAREVVRDIRKRVFWPPRRLPENWADDFADICRSTRFVALPGGEEESDEADA